MAFRTLAHARCLLVLLVAAFVVAGPAATSGAEEAPEVLKGTVVRLKDGVLSLKGVLFRDERPPGRNIDIRTDTETGYYDGPSQVSKESIVPDLIVLVRWTRDGSERKAVQVRIIGGKKS